MWEDPIVAEVHRAREQLAKDCGYDIEAFFAAVRKRQALLGDRLVPPKPRVEQTTETDAGSLAEQGAAHSHGGWRGRGGCGLPPV